MYHTRDEQEHEKLLEYVRAKNSTLLAKLFDNLSQNASKVGLDNFEQLKSVATETDSTLQTQRSHSNARPGQKLQHVKAYDDMGRFERDKFPTEVLRLLKQLDKEKNAFAQGKLVHDRLYANSVLKPIVNEEKKIILQDLQATQRAKALLNETNVLRSPSSPSRRQRSGPRLRPQLREHLPRHPQKHQSLQAPRHRQKRPAYPFAPHPNRRQSPRKLRR